MDLFSVRPLWTNLLPTTKPMNSKEMKLNLELTLDDIQSYTLRLKDDIMSGRRQSFQNSTEGMMGSVDSISDDGINEPLNGLLNSEMLHERNSRRDEASRRLAKFLEETSSTNAQPSDEGDATEWKYPDFETSLSVETFPKSRIHLEERTTVNKRTSTQDSTRAIWGDDVESFDQR
jgi:hypothetical protein